MLYLSIRLVSPLSIHTPAPVCYTLCLLIPTLGQALLQRLDGVRNIVALGIELHQCQHLVVHLAKT
jgi:hypothetical protein